MSRMFFDMMKRLTPTLRAGDVEACERAVADQLMSMPESPFHVVLDRAIANDPAHAAAHFDRFFEAESARLPRVAAAYTEMNGFDINPDRWYCDLFAYTRDGGEEDYDWLSNWQSGPFGEYDITGLEDVQAAYAEHYGDAAHRDAGYMTMLMVVIKFQRFMQAAAVEMTELRFPLYVTAHDFNFIARFEPAATD